MILVCLEVVLLLELTEHISMIEICKLINYLINYVVPNHLKTYQY